MKLRKIILISCIIILCIFSIIPYNLDTFEVDQIQIVISRYNENLEWMKESPFEGHEYIVYNKGPNKDFHKSEDLKEVIQLDNVGREGHTYLYHIIHNYDNLADVTVFLPGSVELPHKCERSKNLLKYIKENNRSALACAYGSKKTVYDMFKDFQIDDYLSSNENNKTMNKDSSMKISDVRPFGNWYKTTFGEDAESKCFTMNGILAISKSDILKKPKSHYEKLITQLDDHQNPETIHYFERSWENVFGNMDDVKYLHA
jgi:hypothetical protein